MILEFAKWLTDIYFYLNALLLLSSCVNWRRYAASFSQYWHLVAVYIHRSCC